MARVRLIEDDGDDPHLADLIRRVKAARRGSLLNLYKALLHSPEVALAWMCLIDSLRSATVLSGRLREIAIIRIAHLNGSAYELKQHVPRLAAVEGLSVQDCEAVARWPEASGFDEKETVVLAYTDSVTMKVRADEQVFETLRRHLSEREIVELTVLIGTYNMHGRVVEPLAIDLEP